MKLTKFQKHVLGRLATGDKLYTDSRRRYATIHRDDFNSTNAERVPYRTLETLISLGVIAYGRVFEKRGEYSVHWFDLTDAGRRDSGHVGGDSGNQNSL